MARLRGRGRLTRSITATVVLLVVGLCLAACQATVQVAVDANLSGAGSITVTATLDREAAAYASDVQFSDLVKAGWSVTGPNTSANGAVTFIAARSFSNPTQAKALFAQLSGTAGPFRGLSLVSRRSLFKSSTTFKGSVDLTCGLDCFGDAQLRQTLGGSANFGIDPAALKNDAGIDLDNLISFQLVARLPGKVMSNAPVPPGAGPPGAGPPGSEAQWKLPLGKRTVVMASSQAANVAHIVIAAVAAFVLLVALVVGMVLLIRRRRRQRPGRAPKNRSRRRPRLRPVKPVNGPTPSVPSAR
ncbi:MAG: hypothetical protein ACRDZ8_12700 [Acidimicrobiales bacterium]